MKLQKILWPTEGLCTEEKLYLHTNVIDDDFNINRDENHLKSDLNFINRSKVYMMPGGGFSLDKGGKVEFDTYLMDFPLKSGESTHRLKKYPSIWNYRAMY